MQARSSLANRLTIHLADELYPTDPVRLRAAIECMRGQFNPSASTLQAFRDIQTDSRVVSLFEAAYCHNDATLMLLTACHAMYLYRSSARTPDVPLGMFASVSPDTVCRIRACAAFAGEIVAAHMAKARFQWFLFSTNRCDLNTHLNLYAWRPRAMILPNSVIPPVNIGCSAVDTYGSLWASSVSINDILSANLRAATQRARIAGLLSAWPGRRGPCYQALYKFMAMRVQEATRSGLLPGPDETPYGNDAHPCEDTRSHRLPNQGALDFPCRSCKDAVRAFVREQSMRVAQLFREAFRDVSQWSCITRGRALTCS